MYGAGDVRVENVPDPKLQEPTDAVVRVVRACICGSDLWPYRSMPASQHGQRMGHEFLGLVEDTGSEVSGLKAGELVVAPFVWADNTCDFCTEGLHTSCRRGGLWGAPGVDGGQGEAVRVPQAQGTLVKLPIGEDGASQYTEVPMGFDTLRRNLTLTGGVAPARAYVEELLPDILDGAIQPGKVFDRTASLEEVPDGYRAMADRTALKVLIHP
jgi:threonine dehydrogenase-like Zn-dependent dehydrogenase